MSGLPAFGYSERDSYPAVGWRHDHGTIAWVGLVSPNRRGPGARDRAGALDPLAPAVAWAQSTTLTVQSTAEPPGLDLTATPASATANVVFYNIQEALVKVDAQGRLVPWLAERWHTTDNLNYTFFLKKGVRFHSGRELTADDVKFALDRARNPETKHPHAKQYEDITTIHVRDQYT